MIKLFEQFNNEQEIIEICKKYNITIGKYIINSDGSIDVDGPVYISCRELTEIPLKFNKVSGNFDCSNSNLTTLKNSPKEVGGYFWCYRNKLTSLEGGPDIVSIDFDCSENQLDSLVGGPKEVGGDFDCSVNKITDLQGISSVINGILNCKENLITSLVGSPILIYGNLNLQDNPLSIIDSSIEIRGESIYIGTTKLDFYRVKLLPIEKMKILFEHGVDYDIFSKDGSINHKRLERLFKDFNI